MKSGVRAVGIAESFQADDSTLAAAIVRADRVVDGFGFTTCTVGGLDATDRIVELLSETLREDIRYVLLAGIAPAWYNLLDLREIHDQSERPICAVTFEASEGLEAPLRQEFSGEALEERLAIFDRQPDRVPITVNAESVFVQSVGMDDETATEVVQAFTPEGGRPEPLRVARLAARAADTWHADS